MSGMRRDGWIGWALVAGVVCGWDVYACLTGGETLSVAYDDAHGHPRRRWKVRTATALILVHLAGPQGFGRLDPLHQVANRLRRRFRHNQVIET